MTDSDEIEVTTHNSDLAIIAHEIRGLRQDVRETGHKADRVNRKWWFLLVLVLAMGGLGIRVELIRINEAHALCVSNNARRADSYRQWETAVDLLAPPGDPRRPRGEALLVKQAKISTPSKC